MDLAYDHIQEEAYAKKDNNGNKDGTDAEKKEEQPQATLSDEVQDAYKAFSNSPWGSRLGGFFSNVAKQVHISMHRAGANTNCYRANPYTLKHRRNWPKFETMPAKASIASAIQSPSRPAI